MKKVQRIIALLIFMESSLVSGVAAQGGCNEAATPPVNHGDFRSQPFVGSLGGSGGVKETFSVGGVVTFVYDSLRAADLTRSLHIDCKVPVEGIALEYKRSALGAGFRLESDQILDVNAHTISTTYGTFNLLDPRYELALEGNIVKSIDGTTSGFGTSEKFECGAPGEQCPMLSADYRVLRSSTDPAGFGFERTVSTLTALPEKTDLVRFHYSTANNPPRSCNLVSSVPVIDKITLLDGSNAEYSLSYRYLGCPECGGGIALLEKIVKSTTGEGYSFEYQDNSALLKAINYPDGSRKESCFDPNGVIKWEKNDKNYLTTFNYTLDSVESKVIVADQKGGVNTISRLLEEYYPFGSFSPGNNSGNQTPFRYIKKVTQELGGSIISSVEYSYDSNNRMERVVTSPGEKLNFRYYGNSWDVAKIYTDDKQKDISLSEYEHGKPQKIKYVSPNLTSEKIIKYNSFGNPIEIIVSEAGKTNKYSFEWFKGVLLAKASLNTVPIYTARYNKSSMLETECDEQGYCTEIKYDDNNRPVELAKSRRDLNGNKTEEVSVALFSDHDGFKSPRQAKSPDGLSSVKFESSNGSRKIITNFGGESSKLTIINELVSSYGLSSNSNGLKTRTGIKNSQITLENNLPKFSESTACNISNGKCTFDNSLGTHLEVPGNG